MVISCYTHDTINNMASFIFLLKHNCLRFEQFLVRLSKHAYWSKGIWTEFSSPISWELPSLPAQLSASGLLPSRSIVYGWLYAGKRSCLPANLWLSHANLSSDWHLLMWQRESKHLGRLLPTNRGVSRHLERSWSGERVSFVGVSLI